MLLLLLAGAVGAQVPPKVLLRVDVPPGQEELRRRYRPPARHPDTAAARAALRELVSAVQADGYLTAGVDSSSYYKDTLRAALRFGPKYRWAHLRAGNVPPAWLASSGYRSRFYTDVPFRPARVVKLQTSLLRAAEDSGHPFATVRLDSIALDGDALRATLRYAPGPFVLLDSVGWAGAVRFRGRFFERYVGLEPGTPFSQARLDAATDRLRQTAYLRQTRPPSVRFVNERAHVRFHLEPRRVNQIDGVIGFLPNQARDGQLLLQGQFNLQLHNLFAAGKRLEARWQRLRPQSQLLDLRYEHPVLFGTPLTASGAFHLQWRDST
ncbi:MAG: hypothetical protein WBA12_15395, partial [Catalinimonas sp.]